MAGNRIYHDRANLAQVVISQWALSYLSIKGKSAFWLTTLSKTAQGQSGREEGVLKNIGSVGSRAQDSEKYYEQGFGLIVESGRIAIALIRHPV